MGVTLGFIIETYICSLSPFLAQSTQNPQNSLSDESDESVLTFLTSPCQPHLGFCKGSDFGEPLRTGLVARQVGPSRLEAASPAKGQ